MDTANTNVVPLPVAFRRREGVSAEIDDPDIEKAVRALREVACNPRIGSLLIFTRRVTLPYLCVGFSLLTEAHMIWVIGCAQQAHQPFSWLVDVKRPGTISDKAFFVGYLVELASKANIGREELYREIAARQPLRRVASFANAKATADFNLTVWGRLIECSNFLPFGRHEEAKTEAVEALKTLISRTYRG